MQNIIIDKPYKFVPPVESSFWPGLLNTFLPAYLKKSFGIEKVDYRGVERLQASLDAGHGILLAPNHARPSDPQVMGMLGRKIDRPFYIMASWHLFMQSAMQRFILRRVGAFSVYREGMDKSALNAAIEILTKAERPLIVFPEGIVSRTNEHLNPLMDGVTFIARNAAKRRAKEKGKEKVVIHAVAMNYFFNGDIESAAHAVLDDIDKRLSWRPKRKLDLVDRIYRTGEALLGLKEADYFGKPQTGEIKTRIAKLIERLLAPLEQEYLQKTYDDDATARVKRVRQAILPAMTGAMAEPERDRRWQQLSDLYLAQQLRFYPPDYVKSRPTPERILETIERFEEDLTDTARVHRPMSVIIEVSEPIEVEGERERGKRGDPTLKKIETVLRETLERNARKYR